ncbi:hypothetical protein [Halomonas sp. BC04]|uniref:hypothetical protein n=1 Tax=Halomonas sp. BC04 TaxID=1403540 RepID=UPI0003ED7E3F|nr:hypothetical protein [Halomonas sp. BC04]EWH03226.1 hypothetical protein Q427_04535 [Halomonas sp. BC04]
MSDDELEYSLYISEHTQRRSHGLIAGEMEPPPPKPQADDLMLTYGDDRVEMSHGRDLLNQMTAELSQMAGSNEEDIATHCIWLIRRIQKAATEQELEPLSNGHILLMLGYFYGKLTMPSRESHAEMTRHFIAEIRRQAGPLSVEAERERGRQWMRERAARIWGQDHTQELRISDVAAQVQSMIKDEEKEREAMRDESVRKWPRSLGKIKEAIRLVAPEYAVRGGRPPRK